MLTFIALLVCGYVLVLGALYFFQRGLIYYPNTAPPDITASGVSDMQPVRTVTSDGLELLSWYRAATPGKPTLVLFQGNAGNIQHRGTKVRQFLDAGNGVMLVGYRGYGGNPGSPSEQGLYADARAALDYLENTGVAADRVVLYGESLGSGVAVKLAAEWADKAMPVAGLVLESPFSSVVDSAAFYYPYIPVGWLLKDRFESTAIIADVAAPVMVIHGERDEVTPVRFGRKLFEAAVQPKQAHWIRDAGHNDLADYGLQDLVLDFLNGLSR
ncbi:MAG: alpha/beta hydrolase [Alphaproteobacteria bacterium]